MLVIFKTRHPVGRFFKGSVTFPGKFKGNKISPETFKESTLDLNGHEILRVILLEKGKGCYFRGVNFRSTFRRVLFQVLRRLAV